MEETPLCKAWGSRLPAGNGKSCAQDKLPPMPSFPKLFSALGTITVTGAEVVRVSFSCQFPLSLWSPCSAPNTGWVPSGQPECQTDPAPFLFSLGLAAAPRIAWKLAREAAARRQVQWLSQAKFPMGILRFLAPGPLVCLWLCPLFPTAREDCHRDCGS